jgi:hypothetical protein
VAVRHKKQFVFGLVSGAVILAGLMYTEPYRVRASQPREHQGIAQQTCKQIHDANDINEARAIASANAKYLSEAAQQEGSLEQLAERCFVLSGDPGWWLGPQ